MAKGYRRVDRDQPFLLPPDMREWIPGDPVWLVIEIIEQHLDTSAFHVGRRTGGVGREGYDPDMLVTLLVWAWLQGVHSSRRIERLCGRDVSFRVICAGDIPDHATIARFRQGFADGVEQLFEQVLVLCARLGLGQVGVVAVDGTKIAAPASPDANRTADGLRKAAEAERARQAAREQARTAGRAHAARDAAEDVRFGEGRGDEMPDDPPSTAESGRGGSSRSARIAAAAADLAAEQQAAEARAAARDERVATAAAGRPAGGRPPAGAEVELAEHALAAARDEVARRAAQWEHGGRRGRHPAPSGVEQHLRVRQAAARVDRARQTVARRGPARPGQGQPVRNITDPQSRLQPVRGGWVQGYNAQAVTTADGIILAAQVGTNPADSTAFQPMMNAAVAAAERLGTGPIGLILADAGYLTGNNLTADGPDRLIAVGKSRDVERRARGAARGDPSGDTGGEVAVQAMKERLASPDGIAAYRQRGRIAETTFGHGKHNLGFRRFTGVGKARAQAEWTFHAAVHNLSKIIAQGLIPVPNTG